MTRMFFIALILLLANVRGLLATELLDVPLPALKGRYYVDMSIPASYYERYVHFELSRTPIAVSRVAIHVSGTFVVGERYCDFGWPSPTPSLQEIYYCATMKDTVNGSWFGVTEMLPRRSGAFDHTRSFTRLLGDPISWDFLKAGYGNLYMAFGFMEFPECRLAIWPEATIEEVNLIVEGEFLVSVRQSTWGSIKSLYR